MLLSLPHFSLISKRSYKLKSICDRNFLFIMADQLAAPALSPYGDKIVKAPAIDALADEGVVFENAYCNLPMVWAIACLASRGTFALFNCHV